MKKMKVSKLVTGLVIALTLAIPPFTPALESKASNDQSSCTLGYVKADGVRLRLLGSYVGDTTLELMYNGETLDYYKNWFGVSMDFNRARRHQTLTYGFVHHDYVRLDS